ncbi:MAG: DNA internalization-related competence protein ComEC/Rec2 [Bacillota bacterium]
MQRPLVMTVAAFTAGIALAQRVNLSLGLTALIAAVLLLAGAMGYRRGWRFNTWLVLGCFLVIGLFWAALAAERNRSALGDWLQTHLVLTGVVVEEPQVYANRVVYTLRAQEVRQEGRYQRIDEKVQVVAYAPRPAGGKQTGTSSDNLGSYGSNNREPGRTPWGAPLYRYGDVLHIHGQLELPPTRRNPGEFDYRSYLARRGVFTRMLVDNPGSMEPVGRRPGNPVVAVSLAAKSRVVALVDRALPAEQAGVLLALLFGDKERLEKGEVERFRDLGVMHVFAVSGLHVGFLLLFLYEISRLLGVPRQKLVFLALPVLWFYAAVTGFTPSVVRAGLMASMALFAYLWDRDRDFYTALGVAAFVILLFNPNALFEPGFQLSFTATWGLVYLYPFLDSMLSFLPPWRKLLVVPLAAQLALVPLTAYYFNILSPGAMVANPLVVPLVGLVVMLGLVMFLFSLVLPPVGAMFALADGAVISFLTWAVEGISYLPGTVYRIRTPAIIEIVLFYSALIMFREYWVGRAQEKEYSTRRPQGIKLIAVVLAVCLLGVAPLVRSYSQKDLLQVAFLDVGQGSAIFIRTPAGRTALVDGGGAEGPSLFDPGAKVIVPYLVRHGIRRLDMVINTHPHGDHLTGLFAVVEKMPVQLVITPPPEFFAAEYKKFFSLLSQRQIPGASARKGDQLWLDPRIEIQVLAPDKPLSGTRSDYNNNSLVLKLNYGLTSILLTGDIEKEAMELLLQDYGDYLDCDIFLIPHHGSKYGLHRGFLAAIQPQAAVIQVGERNSFDHPAPEVIKYWQEREIPVCRNDLHGAITFWSNGRDWRVETELGESRGRDFWRQAFGW